MITKDMLKDYAKKLMFEMNDDEYETLENEFDIILKQMDLIEKIPNIDKVEPMIYPKKLENAKNPVEKHVFSIIHNNQRRVDLIDNDLNIIPGVPKSLLILLK